MSSKAPDPELIIGDKRLGVDLGVNNAVFVVTIHSGSLVV
jgi:hypothetical protein